MSDKINGADVQAKLDNVGKDVKDKINGKQCALGGGVNRGGWQLLAGGLYRQNLSVQAAVPHLRRGY